MAAQRPLRLFAEVQQPPRGTVNTENAKVRTPAFVVSARGVVAQPKTFLVF